MTIDRMPQASRIEAGRHPDRPRLPEHAARPQRGARPRARPRGGAQGRDPDPDPLLQGPRRQLAAAAAGRRGASAGWSAPRPAISVRALPMPRRSSRRPRHRVRATRAPTRSRSRRCGGFGAEVRLEGHDFDAAKAAARAFAAATGRHLRRGRPAPGHRRGRRHHRAGNGRGSTPSATSSWSRSATARWSTASAPGSRPADPAHGSIGVAAAGAPAMACPGATAG